MDTCHVFLSYVFQPRSQSYTKAEMEATAEAACATAETSMRSRGYPVEIHPEIYMEDYGKMLNSQIIQRIKEADIVIADVSEDRPNVNYEVGVAHGLPRRTILLQHVDHSHELFSDIQGMLTIRYRNVKDIRGQLAEAIEDALQDMLSKQDRFPVALRQLWSFGAQPPAAINVIGPDTRRHNDLPHGMAPSRTHPDFARLEFLGDKDSILEAKVQLTRLYSSLDAHIYPASWFQTPHYGEALVVIGGPLGDDGTGDGETSGGNRLTQEITKYFDLPITYTEDCETLLFQEQAHSAEYDAQAGMTADYGVIARLPNPWNSEKRLLLFHGIHTYGVLGAVRALGNTAEGKANAETITRLCGPDPLFFAWCKVPIVSQAPIPVVLNEANIVHFSQEEQRS
jgi:nucleoside 2-deoxyribosyltransferase